MDEIRITPENITEDLIGAYDIFVFGSNESGIHGAGAARFAKDELGFPVGIGFGMRPTDSAFAIPTKDWNLVTLPKETINFYIQRFKDYVEFTLKFNPALTFFVTKLGCGLAGYTIEDIAPMFKDFVNLENVYLPQEFWDIINKQ